MLAKNIIVEHGHFYERETGRRVIFPEGSGFIVLTTEDDFEYPKHAGNKVETESPEIHLADLQRRVNAHPGSKLEKIVSAGESLWFKISMPTNDKYHAEHCFRAELLQDLYVFTDPQGKSKLGELCDCACVAVENISSSTRHFEPVFGKSLNDLWKCTYVHYLGNLGNPAQNAMEGFFTKPIMDEFSKIKYLFR